MKTNHPFSSGHAEVVGIYSDLLSPTGHHVHDELLTFTSKYQRENGMEKREMSMHWNGWPIYKTPATPFPPRRP